MGATVFALQQYVTDANGSINQINVEYAVGSDGNFYVNNRVTLSDPVNLFPGYIDELCGAVNADNKAYFTAGPDGFHVGAQLIILLREGVEKGLTSVAQVLACVGEATSTSGCTLDFKKELPLTMTAAEKAAVSFTLKVKEVFTVPVTFIDDTASTLSTSPWAIPAGSSLAQEVANHWANSSNTAIAAVVKADAAEHGIVPVVTTPVDLSWIGNAYAKDAEKVYLAYFGRPADTDGMLTTVVQIKDAGGDKAAIASMFADSPESQAFYAGKTIAQKVDTVYQQLFDRPAEKAGLDYWVEMLSLGRINQVTMCVNILDGALGNDAIIVDNKVDAALAFSEHITPANYIYSAIPSARMYISSIGVDPADVAKALSAVVTADFANHLSSGISADLALVGLHQGTYYAG